MMIVLVKSILRPLASANTHPHNLPQQHVEDIRMGFSISSNKTTLYEHGQFFVGRLVLRRRQPASWRLTSLEVV